MWGLGVRGSPWRCCVMTGECVGSTAAPRGPGEHPHPLRVHTHMQGRTQPHPRLGPF